jgi:hypothetical protein
LVYKYANLGHVNPLVLMELVVNGATEILVASASQERKGIESKAKAIQH